MITVRRSNERGPTDLGWLKSLHTFSFGSYFDERYMGVSKLRVINDDLVEPGAGFSTHSHKDMEIISYVKKGAIEHKDSMGNIEHLPAGEFQLMTAGTGVSHSEYNPSKSEPLEFLQIWIIPNEMNLSPGYQQRRFDSLNGLQLVVSPDGRDGSLTIHQDASLIRVQLEESSSVEFEGKKDRTYYAQVVSGSFSINGETLNEGDGMTLTEEERVSFQSIKKGEALLFDLP